MKIKKGFVLRKVGNEYIVVATGKMSKEFHGIIKLNTTGMEIWKLFEKENDIDSVTEAIAAEYHMDVETIRKDVQRVVDLLEENAFVE